MTNKHPNRRALLKGSAVSVALAGLPSAPVVAKTKAKSAGGRKTGDGDVVTSNWQFRQVGTEAWLPATVPGTVHTDLLAAKRIEDPFYRTNERDQQWIDKLDWEYQATLTLSPEQVAHEHIDLVFAGIDTFAEVYVNDQHVLTADNMFKAWTADLKAVAKAGDNRLRIQFHSPIKVGQAKLAAYGFNLPATNDQSEAGGVKDDKLSVFARKAGYHYGWDWGPRFVTSGVWRPVTVRAWSGARISDIQIVQDAVSADRALLTAVVEIVAGRAGEASVLLSSETDPTIKASTTVHLAAGTNRIKVPLRVEKPRLWWCNGLGEAFLYTLTARLSGAGADIRDVTIGLRTLKLVQTPDADGESFYVELNGVPVFMKGANYIPNDSFLPRVTEATYEKVVRSAVDTHMNMLRVWGGGVYEDDRFYDLCDRNGILVWQDFMFACSMYPDDNAFLDSIREEAVYNVRRLRNHPSIAIWVGNNEIDAAWQNDEPNGGWGWKQAYSEDQRSRIWNAYKAIFLDILPAVVAEHDGQRFYWSSSPLAGEGRHADLARAKQSGDIHYWDVWWGQKPFADYQTHIGRFMSEYGFQSFPELKTVEAYTVPADHDIFSEVMQAHQRSSIGNGTIKNYMQRDYRVPADFAQFLYVGQVLQAEGIKVAMEAHRSRMPYCMGSLFWQINDCWPVASWSSIDYYGRWKAQQYFARKAFAPVLISAVHEADKVSLTLVSDRLRDVSASVVIEVLDFTGKQANRIETPLILKANLAQVGPVLTVPALLNGLPPEQACIVVSVVSDKIVLAENILYLRPVKDMALPVPAISSVAKPVGDAFALGISSGALVKNLYLTVDGDDGAFEDNYFDVLPDRPMTVVYRPSTSMTAENFKARLRMMHMAQVS